MSPSSPEAPLPDEIAERIAAAGGRARFAGRVALGVYGDTASPPWKVATTPEQRGRVWSIAAIAACEAAPLTVLLLLLPQLAASEGSPPTGLVLGLTAAVVVLLLMVLPAVTLAVGPRRNALAIAAGVNLAVVGVFLGQVISPVWLGVLLCARSALLAISYATNRPLLTDLVVPEARARAMTRYRLGLAVGGVIGAAGASLVWIGPQVPPGTAVTVTSAVAVLVGLLAFRLRDPGFGGAEAGRMAVVFGEAGCEQFRHRPRASEALGRVVRTPAARRTFSGYVGVGWVVQGMVLPAFVAMRAKDAAPEAAVLGIAAAGIATVLVMLPVGWQLERMRRQSPDRAASLAFMFLLIAAVGVVGIGVFPVAAAIPTAFALCAVGGLVAAATLDVTMMSALAPGDRAAGAMLSGLSTTMGAVLGYGFLTVLLGRVEPPVAFVLAAGPVVFVAFACRRLTTVATAGIDELVGAESEAAALADLEDEHAEVPVLAASHIAFSYGSVQALFDVSLRVQPGELVALLGPNGVGKTTLLRVLAGLESPSSGAVRFEGRDVTGLNAPQRVVLGLSEIVGGSAVFGTMTVAENLRMYGYSLGRDGASLQRGMEAAYEAFPKLAERRNQLASTLSGGEQQMLGLSKALILAPKVLLIDEFSLGLAPVIVGDLMAIVRRLNAAGTAVLLVEQSVNVALALCSRVYFMEKGRITFEGRSDALRADPELVKALSLGGAHAEDLARVAS